MKKIMLLFLLLPAMLVYGQTQKSANVYPSNLEENMYYSGYDPATGTISGIAFMVLSDGDNSQDYTPAFEVTLYLIPEGSSDAADTIVVKTYPLEGIYHMGSHEFTNQTVSLAGRDNLPAGRYRLGICVNSNLAFDEDTSDNAILFRDVIVYNPSNVKSRPQTKTQTNEEDSWDEPTEEDSGSEEVESDDSFWE